MFKRVQTDTSKRINITFEGQNIELEQGETVAAALMLAGKKTFRVSAVSDDKRGAFCLMGVCFECLVEIDGVPNRQACMILAEDGMDIRSQKGAVEETIR
ncbi:MULTISPECIES: (2Fe-2S)-binding protein [Alphaproteobacteria]|uniref:(2Fe-2S)-binding protein n=1 Tax=Alphaproteobacteria TaxID=28211 RepID=UPI003A9517AA